MPPIIYIILLIVFAICSPIRCCVSVFWVGDKLDLEIRIKLLFGLIRLKLHTSINILEELNKRMKKKRRKKRKIKPFELLHHIVEKGCIKHIEIHSRAGIKDDAFLTVLLVGFTKIFFEKLSQVMGLSKSTQLYIQPCFATNVFWIHLEGIVTIFPTQIIGIMVLKGR